MNTDKINTLLYLETADNSFETREDNLTAININDYTFYANFPDEFHC